jgi:spermidine synthase
MAHARPSPGSPPRARLYPEIFLVSFAGLLLEISYTRVFSFKISSYYTYLILGFALLGIGGGAVLVAIVPALRRMGPQRLLPWVSPLGGLAVGVGYLAVSRVELSTYAPPSELPQLAALALACAVLFSNFLAVGVAVAAILSAAPASLHRLYGADLAGAGFGCAAAIPLMLWLTPPGCVLASGAALAAAGLRPARGRPGGALACAVATLALAGGALGADALPDPVVDRAKTMGAEQMERWGFRRVFQRWNPVFRVDLLESPLTPDSLAIAHDGDWGSVLWRFDGSDAQLARMFAASNREFPFAVAKREPEVLIIGAAGGNEILASLHFGAARITAVELNPVTVSLLREHFADYTGRLAERERVTLVNAEGRSFLRRGPSRYDVIHFVAPDSYATMNAAQASGFVLVESYLYTKEMVAEALGHLAPGGILCMQFGEVDYRTRPNRTARYLATARRAFAELGIHDFADRVLLATTVDFPIQLSTILLRAEPFTPAQIEAFRALVEKVPATTLRHAPGTPRDDGVVGRVITASDEDLEAVFDAWAYDVSPVSDDAPFFWHFARFRDVIAPGDHPLRRPIGPEDGRGETALLAMLGVSSLFAAAFLLIPFGLVGERWRRLPRRGTTALYFAALGLGFMFYEVALIQKLTLFLGRPTYTLTVTLFALLVSSGIGSLATGRYLDARDRALPRLALALLLLTVFYQFGLDPLVAAAVGWPLGPRVVATALFLVPLGLVLGAFLPLGIGTAVRLGEHEAETVAWCWAVNGVFSVIASMLATIVSMSYGFRALLLAALLLYGAAVLALRTLPLRPVARALAAERA